MPMICYQNQEFTASSRSVIDHANKIITEYAALGFDLTLRQLYYQFVARDLLKNTMKEYKRLGSIINDARIAGLIDWDSITDRTRNLHSLATWDNPAGIIKTAAGEYRENLWLGQRYQPEVWIEKEALSGVFERICDELRVPMFACRGYTSQSEMWSASQRLRRYYRAGRKPVILHFGDHDPSGMDMTRDIRNRLGLFSGNAPITVKRIALTIEQVDEHDPPPNPAKMSDSRATGYVDEFGDESWELDALNPTLLADLVRAEVEGLRVVSVWENRKRKEDNNRRYLSDASSRWNEITDLLDEGIHDNDEEAE